MVKGENCQCFAWNGNEKVPTLVGALSFTLLGQKRLANDMQNCQCFSGVGVIAKKFAKSCVCIVYIYNVRVRAP